MKSIRRGFALGALAFAPGLFGAQPALATPCAWKIVPSPKVGSGDTFLHSIAHIPGTRDVWAVGAYHHAGDDNLRNLVVRWHGQRWNVVRTPSFGRGDNVLTGIAATSPANIWVVGSFRSIDGTRRWFSMRWNGQRWKRFAMPDAGRGDEVLTGIVAVSRTEAWAVGYSSARTHVTQTLSICWRGANWRIVPTPNVGAGPNALYDIARLRGTREVWAVGQGSTEAGAEMALALRWSGGRWTNMSSPAWPARDDTALAAVAPVSPTDAWVAAVFRGSDSFWFERWTGETWTDIRSPVLADYIPIGRVNDMAARSEREVWAVGTYWDYPRTKTLVERWNGSAWSVVASPSPGTANSLNRVAVVPGTRNVWAVGEYRDPDGRFRTLIERYC